MWNLNNLLAELEEQKKPIRVGIIGAGRFGTMVLAQIVRMPGMRVAVIADTNTENLNGALERAGVDPEDTIRTDSQSVAEEAISRGKIVGVEDSTLAVRSSVDVIVEATGQVNAGAKNAQEAILGGKNVVMANVEADVLVGPALSMLAKKTGCVYSLAYGDQPALIKELYDWADALGFEVVAAGKGTKFTPEFRKSTPDTVWELYGHTKEQVNRAGLNATMYNSFLDGTKSAIEMVCVSNMTGLVPDIRGMHFPPVPTPAIPSVLCPKEDGGILSRKGVVEVVSSMYHDGRAVADDLRWGVYVVITSDSPYLRNAMKEYGVATDNRGRYGLLYRPYHFVGMETPLSIANVMLRKEPTGCPDRAPSSEVVAYAKRSLAPGDVIDGEGGFMIYGLAERSSVAVLDKLVPMGLLPRAKVIRPVEEDQGITYEDVILEEDSFAFKLRAIQDQAFPSIGRLR